MIVYDIYHFLILSYLSECKSIAACSGKAKIHKELIELSGEGGKHEDEVNVMIVRSTQRPTVLESQD